jgi:putative sterol carrier protein
MATIAECERAMHGLAGRLAGADPATQKKAAFNRTLSCTLRDLDVIFAGRLHDGRLTDITRVDKPDAQVRLSMKSDDLLRLVDGELNMASALVTGHVKVHASVFDLIRLRSLF